MIVKNGMSKSGKWMAIAALAGAVAFAAVYGWKHVNKEGLPEGIAFGNGRIEAIEIDLATKFAGRVKEISVNQGEYVKADQTIARMDTQTIEAQIREAEAQVRQAQNAKATAIAVVAQRNQAKATAAAVVAQRESELAFAEKELERSRQLVAKGFISPQKLDADESAKQSALAVLSAAKSQVVEAQAGIAAAQSQVVEAQAAIEAMIATNERLKSDMAEAVLVAPRSGRVQYRLVELGEVLPAGGKVVTILDLTDVYMNVYLPETVAGRVAIGSEARLVLDAAPEYVIPAKISFVSPQAQFTPKTVETTSERQKLVFQVKVQIDPELLKQYEDQVKVGLPGVAYVRLGSDVQWPAQLQVKLPSRPDVPRQ